MNVWLEKNKRLIIGFLATVTTTILMVIYQRILVYKNQNSVHEFMDNETIDNALVLIVTMDILSKIMVGVSAVYLIFVVIKIAFAILKNKFQRGENV